MYFRTNYRSTAARNVVLNFIRLAPPSVLRVTSSLLSGYVKIITGPQNILFANCGSKLIGLPSPAAVLAFQSYCRGSSPASLDEQTFGSFAGCLYLKTGLTQWELLGRSHQSGSRYVEADVLFHGISVRADHFTRRIQIRAENFSLNAAWPAHLPDRRYLRSRVVSVNYHGVICEFVSISNECDCLGEVINCACVQTWVGKLACSVGDAVLEFPHFIGLDIIATEWQDAVLDEIQFDLDNSHRVTISRQGSLSVQVIGHQRELSLYLVSQDEDPISLTSRVLKLGTWGFVVSAGIDGFLPLPVIYHHS